MKKFKIFLFILLSSCSVSKTHHFSKTFEVYDNNKYNYPTVVISYECEYDLNNYFYNCLVIYDKNYEKKIDECIRNVTIPLNLNYIQILKQ